MNTTDILEKSLDKFPFTESELLKDLNEYNSHSDEMAVINESEFGPQDEFTFSESELLEYLNKNNLQSDKISVINETEFENQDQ